MTGRSVTPDGSPMSGPFACPCCGYPTLPERPPGTFAICEVCFWEDDEVQFRDPSYAGGANRVSLYDAWRNFAACGASAEDRRPHVRGPTEEEATRRSTSWLIEQGPLDLEPIEGAVLQKLLDGDHPVLNVLRQQMPFLSVSTREHTGIGFYTNFTLAAGAPRADSIRTQFGDVVATIRGLEHGAGFVLWVDDGLLSCLEGYAFGEDWPWRVNDFSLTYERPDRTAELAVLPDLNR